MTLAGKTFYDALKDGPLKSHHAHEHGPQTHALIIGVGSYDYLPGDPEITLSTRKWI